MGEGYHNFHHQFPMDYRNAFRWYQYDPTKWFIAACYFLGLASHLRVFPNNEVEKGALTMKLKELKTVQDSLVWPCSSKDLAVVTWETCKTSLPNRAFVTHTLSVQEESKSRTVILVSGFIHDVSNFLEQHPGGGALLLRNTGKDMTASFFGGVYAHSSAAHNVRLTLILASWSPRIDSIHEASCHDARWNSGRRCRITWVSSHTKPEIVHRRARERPRQLDHTLVLTDQCHKTITMQHLCLALSVCDLNMIQDVRSETKKHFLLYHILLEQIRIQVHRKLPVSP
jgi:cytochrome b involved in lipid metabolism